MNIVSIDLFYQSTIEMFHFFMGSDENVVLTDVANAGSR